MSAARFGYTVLVALAMPFAALYLLWRSLRQPAYRAHWGERFGWAHYPRPLRPIVWVHAVSVGETRAAAPLMEALLHRYPQHLFLLTHMTPTGRATGAEIASRWPGRVIQAYLPYDMPFAVRRFLRAFSPIVGIGMETETWPNLLAAARRAEIPMVLVNARLSEKSLAKARRAPRLIAEAARGFTAVLAQTAADAARIRAVGAPQVEVTGNLKFDIAPDESQVEQRRGLSPRVGRAPGAAVREHARWRGGHAARGAGAGDTGREARPAADHRAAPSAALRRGGAADRRERTGRCATIGRPSVERGRSARHRGAAGRHDGRDGDVLRSRATSPSSGAACFRSAVTT